MYMSASASADELLVSAMEALRARDVMRARELLAAAQTEYDANGGPTGEQSQLLDMVATRVNSAKAPSPPPPEPSVAEEALRAAAKLKADKALMAAVSAFADKNDAERFGKALELLEEARSGFRRAGSDVEREREGVMGNLYAVIRAEQERGERVAKLVRMKRMLELKKQKEQAELRGIDGDEFEAAATAPAEEEGLVDAIRDAWRSEGVDKAASDIDELEQQIQDLEDTL